MLDINHFGLLRPMQVYIVVGYTWIGKIWSPKNLILLRSYKNDKKNCLDIFEVRILNRPCTPKNPVSLLIKRKLPITYLVYAC